MYRIIGFAVLLLIGNATSAQQNDSLEVHPYHFGFIIGLNSTHEKSISHVDEPGFSLGLSLEYSLSKRIYLYTTPILSAFTYTIHDQQYDTWAIEAPLHLMIKPFDWKYAPKLSMGPSYKMFSSDLLIDNIFAEIAFGLERQFKFFSIDPELRYSANERLRTVYFMIHFKN